MCCPSNKITDIENRGDIFRWDGSMSSRWRHSLGSLLEIVQFRNAVWARITKCIMSKCLGKLWT